MGQLSELHGRLLRLKLAARAAFVEAGKAEERRSPPGAIESKALADATENLWRMLDALYGKANFNPNQPRVPRGNPDGGQWTDGAVYGGGGSRVSGVNGEGDQDDEEGASSTGSSDESYYPGIPDAVLLAAVGHHYFPRQIFNRYDFPRDTRRVLEKATSGPVDVHQWSIPHKEYNEAVGELTEDYLRKRGISARQATPKDARTLIREIFNSRDKRIRIYLLEVQARRALYLLRRILPRRMR